MNRMIRFRAWTGKRLANVNILHLVEDEPGEVQIDGMGGDWFTAKDVVLMQFTGLKDKNGLQDVYEGDILDSNGKIKGNIYETNAKETDLVIRGFGTDAWIATYQEAMDRGCKNA